MIRIKTDQKGFSLVELMVVLAISSIVMSGMYAVFNSQIKTNVTQQAAVEMQQSLRTALYLTGRDIRMAGYDPYATSGAGIAQALPNTITITMDFLGGESDGKDNDTDSTTDEADESRFGSGAIEAGETIQYALILADGGGDGDVNGDGVCDGEACNLGRDSGDGNGLQDAALNIQAINFMYLDEDGNPMATPVSTDPDVDPNTTDIRTVQITLVARSGPSEIVMAADKPDTSVYTNQQGTVILNAQNDNIRRTVLSSAVRCRNMGLELE